MSDPPKDFSLSIDEFRIERSLGRGGYGEVVLAEHTPTGTLCAVKNVSGSDEDIANEAAILLKCHNIFIVPFLGIAKSSIITEYQVHGSLFDAIHHKPGAPTLNPSNKTIIAMGISKGMSYLHSQSIIHCDLKPMNVLLDDRLLPKICDFGISRLHSAQKEPQAIGSAEFMAPEALEPGTFSEKSDVYSYAILIWEMLTEEIPYCGLSEVQIALAVVKQKLRPKIPHSAPKALKQLIQKCWSQDPSERPSFSQIYRVFAQKGVVFEGSDPKMIRAMIALVDEEETRSYEIVPLNSRQKLQNNAAKISSDDEMRLSSSKAELSRSSPQMYSNSDISDTQVSAMTESGSNSYRRNIISKSSEGTLDKQVSPRLSEAKYNSNGRAENDTSTIQQQITEVQQVNSVKESSSASEIQSNSSESSPKIEPTNNATISSNKDLNLRQEEQLSVEVQKRHSEAVKFDETNLHALPIVESTVAKDEIVTKDEKIQNEFIEPPKQQLNPLNAGYDQEAFRPHADNAALTTQMEPSPQSISIQSQLPPLPITDFSTFSFSLKTTGTFQQMDKVQRELPPSHPIDISSFKLGEQIQNEIPPITGVPETISQFTKVENLCASNIYANRLQSESTEKGGSPSENEIGNHKAEEAIIISDHTPNETVEKIQGDRQNAFIEEQKQPSELNHQADYAEEKHCAHGDSLESKSNINHSESQKTNSETQAPLHNEMTPIVEYCSKEILRGEEILRHCPKESSTEAEMPSVNAPSEASKAQTSSDISTQKEVETNKTRMAYGISIPSSSSPAFREEMHKIFSSLEPSQSFQFFNALFPLFSNADETFQLAILSELVPIFRSNKVFAQNFITLNFPLVFYEKAQPISTEIIATLIPVEPSFFTPKVAHLITSPSLLIRLFSILAITKSQKALPTLMIFPSLFESLKSFLPDYLRVIHYIYMEYSEFANKKRDEVGRIYAEVVSSQNAYMIFLIYQTAKNLPPLPSDKVVSHLSTPKLSSLALTYLLNAPSIPTSTSFIATLIPLLKSNPLSLFVLFKLAETPQGSLALLQFTKWVSEVSDLDSILGIFLLISKQPSALKALSRNSEVCSALHSACRKSNEERLTAACIITAAYTQGPECVERITINGLLEAIFTRIFEESKSSLTRECLNMVTSICKIGYSTAFSKVIEKLPEFFVSENSAAALSAAISMASYGQSRAPFIQNGIRKALDDYDLPKGCAQMKAELLSRISALK